jgi:molecular chaperone GrpE
MNTETTTQPAPNAEAEGAAAQAGEQPTEQALLDRLNTDLERFKDLATRSAADLENYRKRATREKEDAVKYANGAFLERLIPVLDNFELGLMAARNEAGAGAIVTGFEMVARQLNDFLTASGVEPVPAEPGTPFDPHQHEAIKQEAHAEIAEGAIVLQLRKGFKLRDRLLRPATVVVSKGKES